MKITILAAARLTLIGLGCAASIAFAQSSSASFEMRRQSIDAGAARASSASYTVEGSVGQPDAGPLMSSASYQLRGGFHRPATPSPLPDPLFADGFEG